MSNDALELFNPIASVVLSSEPKSSTFRLDAQYHILFKKRAIKWKSKEMRRLDNCCLALYEVPPFKHIYVDKPNGIPFYTSSTLFEVDLNPPHYLTAEMEKINVYKIKKGQILMARSGDVDSGIMGQLIMVGNKLNNCTTSDHVLRFTPNDKMINGGYLFAYLSSDFCKGELLKNAAGSVIPAIRPDSLRDIQVPIVERNIEEQIGTKIYEAVTAREKAIDLNSAAKDEMLRSNNLRSLKDLASNFNGTANSFKVSSIEVLNSLRFDAHFYNPMAQLAAKSIKACGSQVKQMRVLADRIFMCNRFARTYVDKNNGLPFLSGKNIIQIRPIGLKYVSNLETEQLSELQLKRGWVLITRSGTIGRACLVRDNYEGWCATEDIIRVVPKESEIDGGYLYAFLSSEYGYEQILRNCHGSVIDHITPEQIGTVLIPICSPERQKTIGDKVRSAYEKRGEAIHLEDEAQQLLMKALTGK
jgi:type I restriction enzyme S subunit